MRWCRIRFVLLGLLLCVVQVVSGSCGQRFTDPASSAVLASIVLEGKLQSASTPNSKGIFNIVVKFKNVLKGKEKLKKGGKVVQKVSIGYFTNGVETNEQCAARKVPSNTSHYFFLKEAKPSKAKGLLRLEMMALPVKKTKKITTELKKVVCANCAINASVITVSGPAQVDRGDKLVLKCSVEGNPAPNITWEKANVILQTGDRLTITTTKLSSKLVVNTVSDSDMGQYECVAANALGESRKHYELKAQKPLVTVSGPAQFNRSDTLVLNCSVEGIPTPHITWKRGNETLQTGDRFTITTTQLNSTLVVNPVSDNDTSFECVAANSWGETGKPHWLRGNAVLCVVQTFCLNGGTCYYLESLGLTYCNCLVQFGGKRCEENNGYALLEPYGQASTFFEKPPVLVAILAGLILFIMVCLASFYLVKRWQKRRQQQRQRKSQEAEAFHASVEERNSPGRPAVVNKWACDLTDPNDPASEALIQPRDIRLQDYSPPPVHQSQPNSGSRIFQQAFHPETSTNDSSRKPEARNRLAASSSVYDNFGNSDILDSSTGGDTPKPRQKTAGHADTKVMFDINTGNIAKDNVDQNNAYKNLNSFMRPTNPVDRPLAQSPPSLPKLSSSSSLSSSPQLPSTSSDIVSSQSGPLPSLLPEPSELFVLPHQPAVPSSSISSQNSSSELSPSSTGKPSTADHPAQPNHVKASSQSVHPAEPHYDNQQIPQQQNQPLHQAPTILSTSALSNQNKQDKENLLSDKPANRDELRAEADQQFDLFISEDDIDLSKENLKSSYFSPDHVSSKQGYTNKEGRSEYLTSPLKPRFSSPAGKGNARKSPATNRNLPLQYQNNPSPPDWTQPSPEQVAVSSEDKHLNNLDAGSPDLDTYSNLFPQTSPASAAQVYCYDPNEDTTPWDRDISRGDNSHYAMTAESSADQRHRLKDVLPDQRAIPI